MKQVRVHAPGDVRVDEVPEPVAGPGDVVVRVAACGICGTDLTFAKMGPFFSPPGASMALGHELSGVIDEIGPGVTAHAVGDRVVVKPGDDVVGRIGCGAEEGGLAARLLVRHPERRLFRVPDGVDLETAALAEPLAVGMNAADQSGAQAGDSVAVFGCGPVGLAAIATLADRGVESLVAVDPSASRRALALHLGASHAIDPTSEDAWARLRELHGAVSTITGPAPGTDAFVEASGVPQVFRDLVGNARSDAVIAIVALHMEDVPVSLMQVMTKQLTLRGAMEYPERFESALELLARRDLSEMATHRFDLTEFDLALGLLKESKECGKVLVTFGEEA